MVLLALLILPQQPLVLAEGAVSQPQPAVTARGSVHVAWVRDGRQVVVRGIGAEGALAEPVDLPEAVTMAGMRRGPRIAAAGERLCVTAVVVDPARSRDGELMAWSSSDGGRTWDGPRPVSDAPRAAREGLHAMAGAADGTLGCAWLDLRSGRTEIFAAFSADGGRTWSPNVRAYRSPDGTVCECCAPAVAFGAEGSFLVLFRNWHEGCRDMWLVPGGTDGFEKAEKLGRGSWRLSACPMAAGGLARGPKELMTFWPREDHVFQCEPGGKEKDLGRGAEVTAAAGPGGAFAAWVVPGSDSRLMLLRPGAREPETIAKRARWPALASAPGGAAPPVLVWEDHNAARVALRLLVLAGADG